MPPRPRQLHDEYFKKAKDEGYLARSAYKLKEIQEKRKLIRSGDAVLDLGCAPGSWMQVASELVGPRGYVVGIDLTPITHPFGSNVHHIQGDIYKTPADKLRPAPDQLFDVVISDMAPNTSGHGDDFLSVRLCRRMLDLLPDLLRPRGNAVMKVLEGTDFPALLEECKVEFADAGALKPKASRDVSRETFIWCKGYLAKPRPIQEPARKLPPHLRPGGDHPRSSSRA
ncbi:MAG: RlmE family RNA methyltransferase [Planctomycetes bacterium]|nr:RlmE family RNA methyltransferase [Planctomycetota bacterium]